MPTPHAHGTPVHAPYHVSLIHGQSRDGRPLLFAKMNQSADCMYIIVIDVDSGRHRQIFPPIDLRGGHLVFSHVHHKLFIAGSTGEQTPGCVLSYTPGDDKMVYHGPLWTPPRAIALTDRGRAIPITIAEADDGRLYIGCYGYCDLYRFDPVSERIEELGSMDDEEYYFYVSTGRDGTVAGVTRMANPHVVVFDPDTGEHRAVGPAADTDAGTGHVRVAQGDDGLLYADTHEGWYAIRGMNLHPIDQPPVLADRPTLPDGSTYRFGRTGPDCTNDWKRIEIVAPDGSVRHIDIDYQCGGTEIYIVRPGPDGNIYGSSILPMHFFEYEPDHDRLVDHGRCSTSGGEIYSLDHMDGLLYYCAYTHAILGVYDPTRPYQWRWPQDDDANPRQIGRMDDVAYRPRDMIAGPGGKVWVASVPDYGMWGGTLSWYDPKTDALGGGHRHILRDCSPYTLTQLPALDQLVVGFTIYAGSGTSPKATRAGIVLWDPHTDQPTWQGDLDMHIIGVMDLEDAGDGLTYAIVHPAPADVLKAELLLLDLPNQRIVSRAWLHESIGWPLEVTFQRNDKYLIGATREGIYRVPLGSTEIEVLWRRDEHAAGPTCGGALLDNTYYFGAGSTLYSIKVD